jgi:galactoside O-acetyltransferase
MSDDRKSFIGEMSKIVNEKNLETGKNIGIDDFVLLNAGKKTKIGDNSCIHSGSRVIGGGSLVIGNNAVVTYNCVLVTGYPEVTSHMSSRIPVEQKDTVRGTIVIGDEAFVGSNSVIMPDTQIGEGAVVAAMSYVDSDVPDWTVRYPDGSTKRRPKLAGYE